MQIIICTLNEIIPRKEKKKIFAKQLSEYNPILMAVKCVFLFSISAAFPFRLFLAFLTATKTREKKHIHFHIFHFPCLTHFLLPFNFLVAFS